MASKVLPDGDKLRPRHLVDARYLSVVTDPDHQLFDDRVFEPPDPFLVDKIDREGFTSAILVRRDGPFYQVIDGRRRRAALIELVRLYEADPDREGLAFDRSAGFVACFVEVVIATDAEAEDLMIAANASAKPYTELQCAALIARRVKRGMSMEEAVRPFNILPAKGHELVRMLQADDSMRAAVADKTTSVTAAARAVELPREQQREMVERARAEGRKLSVNEVRRAVDPKARVTVTKKEMDALFRSKAFRDATTARERGLLELFVFGDEDALSMPELEGMREILTAVRAGQ